MGGWGPALPPSHHQGITLNDLVDSPSLLGLRFPPLKNEDLGSEVGAWHSGAQEGQGHRVSDFQSGRI